MRIRLLISSALAFVACEAAEPESAVDAVAKTDSATPRADGTDAADATDATDAVDASDATDAVDASDAVDGAPSPIVAEYSSPTGGPTSRLMVVDRLIFPEVSEDQTMAVGFDLDATVSDETDNGSCNKTDLTSPDDGAVGVDNQLATVIPLLDLVGLGAFQTLVQRAIEEGGLLIFFEVEGMDDPLNDPEVTMTLRVGEGVPLLGTDGRLLAGQTFHVKPGSPSLTALARIEGGILRAEGFNTIVPVVVFGVPYQISMNDAMFEGTLTADGGLAAGMLGGTVPLADIIAIATKANNNDDSILEAVQGLMGSIADLDQDEAGTCRAISAAIQVTGVSAFLFEDHFTAPPPAAD